MQHITRIFYTLLLSMSLIQTMTPSCQSNQSNSSNHVQYEIEGGRNPRADNRGWRKAKNLGVSCIAMGEACTFASAHGENRWTGGCKQTRRMPKLLSPMHPLFQGVPLCYPFPLIPLPPDSPNFPSPSSSPPFSDWPFSLLAASLWTPGPTSLFSVSRLPSCDTPTSMR